MKNIQVIDSASNCSFSVYSVCEEDFALLFAMPDQDIEFIEDVVIRLGECSAGDIVRRSTRNRVKKPQCVGIHGTLFFGLLSKKVWYPNKREADLDLPGEI